MEEFQVVPGSDMSSSTLMNCWGSACNKKSTNTEGNVYEKITTHTMC